jgi:uncharacterized protein
LGLPNSLGLLQQLSLYAPQKYRSAADLQGKGNWGNPKNAFGPTLLRERSFTMLIEGQFTLQAPIQKVWDSLLDPKTLGTCVPGTEMMEAIDKETYESVVKQRVGPFKVKLKFTTKLTEVRPPNYIKAVGRGADVTKLGNFSTEIEVKLKEISANNVEVSYAANVSLVGRLATFGERIMRAKAKEVGDEFTANLQEKLKTSEAGA